MCRPARSRRTATTRRSTAAKCAPSTNFFGAVCDALDSIPEVLAVGPRTGLADFEHYARKHRAETAARVVAYEVVDHPSEKQRVALARKQFLKIDRMVGGSVPP